jgi:hypothetical protein
MVAEPFILGFGFLSLGSTGWWGYQRWGNGATDKLIGEKGRSLSKAFGIASEILSTL